MLIIQQKGIPPLCRTIDADDKMTKVLVHPKIKDLRHDQSGSFLFGQSLISAAVLLASITFGWSCPNRFPAL